MAAGIVVIFDFDKTIIDCDDWVLDELGATELFNQLLPTLHWNSLMVITLSLFTLHVLAVSFLSKFKN